MQILRNTKFKAFNKALSMSPEEVIEQVKASGLTGRGGAHFLTGLKWQFIYKEKGPDKILICNADEGEPGTFKDRFIIRNNPELLIEGIAIAAYAIGANRGYIYLRAEYKNLRSNLERAIQNHQKELAQIHFRLDIFMGQGAYICGDETAIMNSIEGYRGEPRSKPPYPAQRGLFGLPTCINNVTTLSNVPLILNGDWSDSRLFSLSGNVSKPGVYELSPDSSAGDLMALGEPFKPIKALFFGCAGGCVPFDPNLRLSKEGVAEKGAMIGSFAVIAVDEDQSIPAVCRNIAEFFVHESCGGCTPCRKGNVKVMDILNRLTSGEGFPEDIEQLITWGNFIQDCAFCGLGQTSNNHVLSALTHFRKEFEELCKSSSMEPTIR